VIMDWRRHGTQDHADVTYYGLTLQVRVERSNNSWVVDLVTNDKTTPIAAGVCKDPDFAAERWICSMLPNALALWDAQQDTLVSELMRRK
jgi:hypothetical protein